ncbi:MAG: TlpA family protein disulfide reductase [Isosphaeraceae bacterium]
MTHFRIALAAAACLSLVILPSGSKAQQAAQRPAQAATVPAAPGNTAAQALKAINDDYNTQLLQIERNRLDRLARLAAGQPDREASQTYEILFRLAIANNLFAEAEAAADRVRSSSTITSPVVRLLAETVNIIATADRGAFDESLADLGRLVGAGASGAKPGTPAPAAVLDTPSLLSLCGAYYQRLVQAGRFDVAHKAFALLNRESTNPDVKEFSAHRLRQLDLLGKPSPEIKGTDVDGRPFDLAALKGNVVLVVFWASWCVPNAAEVAWLDQVYSENRERGFRVVGINLDTLQNGGTRVDAVMPSVRRFLLDHNVRWPNLINGQGPADYAGAYGVTEIPSNVLIGRDGSVIQVDLSRKNMDQAVARAVGQ